MSTKLAAEEHVRLMEQGYRAIQAEVRAYLDQLCDPHVKTGKLRVATSAAPPQAPLLPDTHTKSANKDEVLSEKSE